jgi:2-aminoadipate transaminase
MSAISPTLDGCLAAWARASRPSPLQRMLSLTARPGVLSFALGLPSPDLFPRDDVESAAAAVLRDDPLSLQYAPPLARMKTHIVQLMAARGLSCTENQVFLTAGAQQGMSLLARVLVEPRSRVIVEQLTYPGFRQILEPFDAEIVEIPTSASEGMDLDALARVLATGPRPVLLYTMSHGHNPLSISLAAANRTRLTELCARYGVPIVEDDAYGFLQYGEALQPPLAALDANWVCYVGSFSKILAPGLRQGWLVVPEAYARALSIAKESSDIDMAPFTQRILAAYLDTGRLPTHIDLLRREYRTRRDAMLRAIETHLPAARCRIPEAGLFVWVELTHGVDTADILDRALQQGVAFLPGAAFGQTAPDAARAMRLNFSLATVPIIEEGMARLGRAVAQIQASRRRSHG